MRTDGIIGMPVPSSTGDGRRLPRRRLLAADRRRADAATAGASAEPTHGQPTAAGKLTARSGSPLPDSRSRPNRAAPAAIDPGRRVAGLSRTRARRRRPRRAHRHRLVRSRRRSRCGAGRSVRAGHPSRFAAISSTRRSSAATTRSSPATRWPPASRCGDIAMRSGSGSRMPAPVRAGRRPSATVASTRSARPES